VTELFLAIAAAAIGLPVFVVCAGLALRRKTRYFAIPPVLGVICGAVAALTKVGLALLDFVIAFSIVAVPIAAVCGFVALIEGVDTRWPNAVRNSLAAMFAIVAVLLVLGELDRPGSEPAGQFVGTVRNSSVAMRSDGMVEERMDVALDDGRRVAATAIREAAAAPETFPPRIPEPWEPERVRLNEFRSIITGKSSYSVAGVEGRVTGTK
jgi:hypothetical protein